MLVPRYNETDTKATPGVSRTGERGSSSPDLEMRGPDALPLSHDALQLGTPRDTGLSRKAERRLGRLTLLRTYLGYALSIASAPSCDDEQAWHVPISFPYAHENRAS